MEEHIAEDQSHYEISLTAGQAFVAFVLLLLSLAASFAFGLMLGRGQADERLVVRKDTPIVTEAGAIPGKKSHGDIVELAVENDDFTDQAAKVSDEPAAATTDPVIEEQAPPATASDAPVTATAAAAAPVEATPIASAPEPRTAKPASSTAPFFAQLLSTGDQKTAEALAVRLINRGFTSSYVERGSTEKGPIFRVRVRFASEAEARASEARLHEFSKDVWITSK